MLRPFCPWTVLDVAPYERLKVSIDDSYSNDIIQSVPLPFESTREKVYRECGFNGYIIDNALLTED